MNTKSSEKKRSITFLALLAVFFLPLLLAIGMYLTRSHWQLESNPHGELLTPTLIPLDIENKPRLWRVLFVAPDCVNQDCVLQLAKINSVHEATGKDFDRAGSALITTSDNVDRKLLENFNKVEWFELDTKDSITPGLYIMDPNGYIILQYSLDTPGAYLLQDLRHLLKVSQIG